MRLQKISTCYSTYVNQFYSHRADLAARPYAIQHGALMNDCFGWADFWSVALSKLGLEASEVVANAKPMQKQWALEHGLRFDETNWLLDITRAQVQAFHPDVLFVDDYTTFTGEFLRQLREDCPSIRLVLGWCGAPYNNATVFREYDLILSCIPEMTEHFRQNGHRAYHLDHAFEPRILERIDLDAAPSVDFSFLGSIVKGNAFHDEREKLLLALVEQTDMQIWTDVGQPQAVRRRNVLMRRFAYDAVHAAQQVGIPETLLSSMPLLNKIVRWEARPSLPEPIDDRIVRRARPPLFGLAMFQQLHDSKVALNTHIDISSKSASNMRLYETTGVGSCLLTDWKPNLAALFAPDIEVVTYRGVEECLEKVRYLLDHQDERLAIAGAGQRRTLRNHTFTQRSEQLCEIINSHFAS